jgi:hypothetical protein
MVLHTQRLHGGAIDVDPYSATRHNLEPGDELDLTYTPYKLILLSWLLR